MLRRLLALASLLPACGPGSADTEPATTTTLSSSEAGSSSTSLADPTGTPTTGTTTTDATGTTTTDATGTTAGTSTGASPTTTTTGTSSTTAGTTGGADVEYTAYFWAGGLDHLVIHRADFGDDRCTTVHLARPGGANPQLLISVPDDWFPVGAAITDSSAGCLEDMPMGTSVAASGGLGMVSWPLVPNQLCPPQIDLDLVLDFPLDQPWVPAQTPMLVTALPVKNCP